MGLNLEVTMNYYKKELSHVLPVSHYEDIRIKITGPRGSTNHLSINRESINALREYVDALDRVWPKPQKPSMEGMFKHLPPGRAIIIPVPGKTQPLMSQISAYAARSGDKFERARVLVTEMGTLKQTYAVRVVKVEEVEE